MARRPAAVRRARDPAARPGADGRHAVHGRPRLSLRGEHAREGRHLAPVPRGRLLDGDAAVDPVAPLDLLGRVRARARFRDVVRGQGAERGHLMKAVVMAGGEGTRLRPLTSNQPKPRGPIVGKPCMEHTLELLGEHGFEEVVVTVAFLPQAIRSYFGDGEPLGLDISYSVEESPLGTAGSVRLASDVLDETFLVIS